MLLWATQKPPDFLDGTQLSAKSSCISLKGIYHDLTHGPGRSHSTARDMERGLLENIAAQNFLLFFE